MQAKKSATAQLIEHSLKYGKKTKFLWGFITQFAIASTANYELYNKIRLPVSISISKQYAKSSVKRNKIRRQLKAALTAKIEQLRSQHIFMLISVRTPTQFTAILNDIV